MINDYEATKPMTTDAYIPPNTENESVIDTLNGLIEICKDAQAGFKEASEGVESSDLKSFFGENSLIRSKFAGDLQTLVQSLGGDPEKTGSIAGTLHRGWMDIKAAVMGNDEAAILNECERGEDAAKSAYQDALSTKLPEYVRETVQSQYENVLAIHDKVKALRDAFKERSNSAASSR